MVHFLRIALNAAETGALPTTTNPLICAVKVKEPITTGMYKYMYTIIVL